MHRVDHVQVILWNFSRILKPQCNAYIGIRFAVSFSVRSLAKRSLVPSRNKETKGKYRYQSKTKSIFKNLAYLFREPANHHVRKCTHCIVADQAFLKIAKYWFFEAFFFTASHKATQRRP